MHVRNTALGARRSRAGITLLEVAVAAVIVASIMVFSNAAFLSSFNATDQAQDQRTVALLLESVMEDVGAQSYDTLLALNGNVVFDGADEGSSRAAVTIEAFEAEANLIQVRAIARDLNSGREVGRVVTQRSAR